ncbi:lysophospholipid acyltransferase family protein [Clostridium thailandense]|uniref:lysophospholipid acyltransferase family protein n=1 Tax=Clostridium thailandense TaxID=2794346 RepID=UPI003988A7B0
MISPGVARIVGCLPKSLIRFFSRKLIDKYLKTYAYIEVTGMENLENVEKPILFICNHLSNSDGLIIDKVLKDQDITFVAGAKLSKNPLTSLGVYVTKTITINPNTADKEAISEIVKTLRAGKNVLIFPEGTRSRTGSLIKAKKGIVLIQRLTRASVIPLGICGSEKLLPVHDKDMGQEKFYHAKVKLSIGKELQLPAKGVKEEKHEYEERTTNFLMKKIAELLPLEYRGVYK